MMSKSLSTVVVFIALIICTVALSSSDGHALSLRQLVRKCSIKALREEALSSSAISKYLSVESNGIEVGF
jgi:hypothetical protein